MAINVFITDQGISLQDLQKYADNLDGRELVAGVLRTAGREKKTGVDLVDVATWNEYGTSRIPKRPFMRIAEMQNRDKWFRLSEKVARNVLQGAMDVNQSLELIGNKIVGDIREVIGDRTLLVPNAPSTIRQKGSDAPLIDTGQLRQSISFEVR